MKTIIVFYSRTGTTKRVGENLAEFAGAETEEIKDTKNRAGAWGFITSGKDARKKVLTKLEPIQRNLADYDLVIVGTPIWGWTVSVPVRTFLEENKQNLKQVAFFCTMGGSGAEKAFVEMERVSGKKPIATLSLTTKEVAKGNFEEKVKEFAEKLPK